MDLDPRHPTWQGLVAAARANRDEDLPRELIAEHLADAHGTGVIPLERFIRGSLELGREDPTNQLALKGWDRGLKFGSRLWMLQQEQSAILNTFWRPLLFGNDSLPQHLQAQWRWHRGFPDHVVVTFDWWTHYADTLCALGPVGEVFMVDMPPSGTTDYWSIDRREFWVRDSFVNRRAGKANSVMLEVVNGHVGWAAMRAAAETIMRSVWREGVEVASFQIDEGMYLILDGG